MPDTLKQFFNATTNVTGLTGAQTIPLFTNNATTRAVIKDIQVTNTFPVTPNLIVGGTVTTALGSSVTGSEIVDVSQAVTVSFPTALTYTSTTLAYLNGSTQRFSLAYNINGTPVSTVTADQALPAIDAGASYVPVIYYAPDGDVFSAQTDGNGNCYLFKNAGSAGGTRTTINTGNETNFSPIAFDGQNTFYWFTTTTNLRAFNADTETTTNTTVSALPAGTVQPRLIHSNGYLLYVYAGDTNPYLVEISTGRWAQFTGFSAAWNANATIPGFWFEPSTRVATIMSFFGASTYYRWISPAIPAFTAASVVIATPWPQTTLANNGFQTTLAATSSVTIVLSSADGGVIFTSVIFPALLSGISGPTSGWTISTALNNSNGATWRPRRSINLSPTLNTTNFPSTISLRITGVEVTP